MSRPRPERWIVMEELRRLQPKPDPYRGLYDTPMLGWKWLMFDGAISHAVSEELYDVIVVDLERRGCELKEETPSKGVFFDRPGMIATERPVENLFVDGLELNIPSEDVLYFTAKLEALELRDGCYYKLHDGWRCALVLTQGQRDELLAKLKELVPGAEARAAEFWATRKLPSEVLREIAAKQSGRPIEEIPNLGGNKNDRFKPKGSGSLPN